MPKQVIPLTNTQVTSARRRAREYNLPDGKGLYLRVKPNGTRLWIFNYQAPFTKRRSNISFGTFPPVTLARARSEREICRELLAQDIDPKHARAEREEAQARAHANTLEAVAEKWLKMKSAEITDKYAGDIRSSLESHVFPKLGNRPLHKITARDVIEVLSPLEEAGKRELVKRICQRLNMIMDYAVVTDVVAENRLIRIGRAFKSPIKANLPSIGPDKLPELLKAICEASLKPVTRCLIKWQLHTMVRPSEAAGARWAEIDMDNKVWNIPAERMKKRRSHSVPLTTQTMAILQTVSPYSEHRQFIFPSDVKPKQHASTATVNMALKRMGFKGKLVSHGFRSLASTTLNEQGFDSDIIEAALAHTDKDATRAAYNRAEHLERRRTMMCWWSERIEEAAKGREASKGKKHLKLVNQ